MELGPEFSFDGNFDLIGIIQRSKVVQAISDKEPSEQLVRLKIELCNHRLVTIDLPQNVLTRAEYEKFDIV